MWANERRLQRRCRGEGATLIGRSLLFYMATIVHALHQPHTEDKFVTRRLKIAQKPYVARSLGPKALRYESSEP